MVAAAENGETGKVRTFLSQGVPVDGQDRRGWTALTIAAQTGRNEIAELLIANGANLNLRDNVGMGRTALMRACIAGNSTLVNILLAHNADIGVKLDDGSTALSQALPYPQIVQRLIEAGANVNERRESRLSSAETALIAACSGGYTETVHILVEHGADLQKDHSEVLDSAARNGHADVIQMLVSSGIRIDKKALEDSLLSAYAHPEALRRLISAGADVNARCAECNGRTTLMISAVNVCPEAVQFLISAGADLNLKDNKGHTALDLALASMNSSKHGMFEEKRFSEIIDSLRRSGATESGLKVEWPETW
jgi:ankyrin repeat protein